MRPVVLAVVVHRGDAGVVQRGGDPGLGAEPVQELRVAGQLGPQDLHRDDAGQPDVVGRPDLAHPADGDPPVEPVAVGHGDRRRGRHHDAPPSAAAITARPIGAATWTRRWPRGRGRRRSPPAPRPRPAGCRRARTRRTRRAAGCSSGPSPCSAVPVFDAITRPVILPPPGVEFSDSIIRSVSRRRRRPRDRPTQRVRLGLVEHRQVGLGLLRSGAAPSCRRRWRSSR